MNEISNQFNRYSINAARNVAGKIPVSDVNCSIQLNGNKPCKW